MAFLICIAVSAWGGEHALIAYDLIEGGDSNHENHVLYASSVVVDHRGESHLTTRFVDTSSGELVLIAVDGGQRVRSSLFGTRLFHLVEGTVKREDVRFYHENKVGLAFSVNHQLESPTCPNNHDASVPLQIILESEPLHRVAFDRPSYATLYDRPSGPVTVWKRLPHERAAFGHPIRAVQATSKHGPQQLLFNIQTKGCKVASLNRNAAATAQEELDTLCRADGKKTPSEQQFQKAAIQVFNSDQAWSREIVESVEASLAQLFRTNALVPSLDEQVKIVALVRQVRLDFDAYLSEQGCSTMDPFIRGVAIEQVAGNHGSVDKPFFGKVLSAVERVRPAQPVDIIDQAMELSLYSALADLGFAPNSFGHSMLTRCIQGDFSPATCASVLARWDWPINAELRDSLIKFIEDCGLVGAKLDAVESAILAGAFNRVPAAAKDRWYVERVIDATPEMRRRSLAIGVRDKACREFFVEKLADLDQDSTAYIAIATWFAHVAKETVKYSQFDFISEDECKRLERMHPEH